MWRSRHRVPLPLDYRRILGLVDYAGHRAVIRSHLGRFAPEIVDEWLANFAGVGLIASDRPPASERLASIGVASPPPIEPEDLAALEEECSLADISLTRLGVYVATDRVSIRAPTEKAPSGTRVLVVEDDPDQRVLATRRLNGAGYVVATAGTVRELYEFLERDAADAVVLDINLPDGDGFSALTAMRRHPVFTFLPVVMLTARSSRADIVKGLSCGADAYVTKSYGPNTIDYVLRFVLNQQQATSSH